MAHSHRLGLENIEVASTYVAAVTMRLKMLKFVSESRVELLRLRLIMRRAN
jgi:hypothetical protein